MSAGIALIIANGEDLEILRRIMSGEPVGTLFVPRENHLRFRNQWLAFGSKISGKIIVDEGLAKALRQKGSCSILPVGITAVEGSFDSGDTVSVRDQEDHELARGMTNYNAEDLNLIKGCKTSQIEEKIGYKIREAQTAKIPYMLVVGQKEEEENTVSVRSRAAGDEGARSLDTFIADILKEIETKENRVKKD
jgi:glutamate 5-kinase